MSKGFAVMEAVAAIFAARGVMTMPARNKRQSYEIISQN
jgi:hypothetical protein